MNRLFEDIIRDQDQKPVAIPLKVFLRVASWAFGLGVFVRNLGYAMRICPRRRLPKPVISIGNITVGGTGKTPLVIALARVLIKEGYRPAVLSRGYRSFAGAVGNDEVWMMRDMCPELPVVVGKNRYEVAMQFLFGRNIDVFLMDDGFQHRQLVRDLDIVAVDSIGGFGNGSLLPRGILREPLSQLKRAQILVLTKFNLNPQGAEDLIQDMKRRKLQAPLIYARQRVTGFSHLKTAVQKDAGAFQGQKVMMMSSIADPRAFEQTILQQGMQIAGRALFSDHHHYTPEDLNAVMAEAQRLSVRTIMTTRKDAVKLDALATQIPGDMDVWILNIDVEFVDHENILLKRIHSLLGA